MKKIQAVIKRGYEKRIITDIVESETQFIKNAKLNHYEVEQIIEIQEI